MIFDPGFKAPELPRMYREDCIWGSGSILKLECYKSFQLFCLHGDQGNGLGSGLIGARYNMSGFLSPGENGTPFKGHGDLPAPNGGGRSCLLELVRYEDHPEILHGIFGMDY